MCDFEAGDRVVCVDDDDDWIADFNGNVKYYATSLVKNRVYLVVDVVSAVEGSPSRSLFGCLVKGTISIAPFSRGYFETKRFRRVDRSRTESGMRMLRGLLETESTRHFVPPDSHMNCRCVINNKGEPNVPTTGK